MLGELIERGHAKKGVCIDKRTFNDPLEPDGLVVIEVKSVGMRSVVKSDGDGGTKMRADGSECMSSTAILCGDTRVAW